MITKLEQGHTYKDKGIGLFIFLEEDEDGYIIYSPGDGMAYGVRRNRIDLSTLVEVCYVDGEEMIVGAEYMVESDPKINPFAGERSAIFHGVVDGKPVFKQPWNLAYEPFQKYTLVEPVTTYTLVKSIDGKEVSRVEVSEEKAKDLC